ncbi:MAG: polysaccharide deacetylase family protein [Nannocystaceae bacterium]
MSSPRVALALAALLGCTASPRAAPPKASARTLRPADVAPPRSPAPIQLALTFDDLPAHGPVPAGATRRSIHADILATLARHRAPAVYGFTNLGRLDDDPDRDAALVDWRAAGHPLGNHTFDHVDLNAVGPAAFLEDLERNTAGLLARAGDDRAAQASARVFRYPYLRQGRTLEERAAVRDHLARAGYRIAEVTIDFGDWAYNKPYARCLAAGDARGVRELEDMFFERATEFLRWSDETARALFGRPIPHVLLLHAGAFDARVLDRTLDAYEALGVEYITLEEALADPVYALDIPIASEYGGSLLEQYIEAYDPPHPPFPSQGLRALEAMCATTTG